MLNREQRQVLSHTPREVFPESTWPRMPIFMFKHFEGSMLSCVSSITWGYESVGPDSNNTLFGKAKSKFEKLYKNLLIDFHQIKTVEVKRFPM